MSENERRLKSQSLNHRDKEGKSSTKRHSSKSSKRRRRRSYEGTNYLAERRPKQSYQPGNSYSEKKPKGYVKIIHGVLNLIFYFLTISILVGAILFSVSKDSNKAFFGYRFYSVLTNSMRTPKELAYKDGFSAGDIIIVQMINPAEIKKKDIITFNILTSDPKSDAVLTHRVIDIKHDIPDRDKGRYFVTKGDANTGEDTPVSEKQVVGKVVWSIPKVGVVLSYIREYFYVSIGVLVSFFALIVSLRYYFSYSPDSDPLENSGRKRKQRQ